jgi:hypothetical protein
VVVQGALVVAQDKEAPLMAVQEPRDKDMPVVIIMVTMAAEAVVELAL